ncbi:NUDIX domain-containing protein [Oleispirillum naphthae]|uniref:NUDIX domain-containing protein n=1 Tax=Oleispirillum naphthae TaxID=2838853 RepID=UPI0030822C67
MRDRRFREKTVPCVSGLFVRRGQVLLTRRGHAPRQGEWSLPGGRIAAGETPLRALVREMAEETGLAPLAVLPFAHVTVRHRGGPAYRILCFRVFSWHGRARAGDDATACLWTPLARLPGVLKRLQTRRVIAAGAKLAITARGRPRRYE